MRHPKLTSPTFLRRRLTAAAAAATWTTTNRLYLRHPRLGLLEHSPHHLHSLLAYTITTGLFRNPFVASRLLLSSTSSPSSPLPFSATLFSQIPNPTAFHYNTLLRALPHPHSLALYTQMLSTPTRPDNFTLPFLIRSNPDVWFGRRLHAHALMLGFMHDPFVHTALVTMYLTSGYVADAVYMFGEMTVRDVVAWTGLISGLSDLGCYDNSLKMFRAMRWDEGVRPNVATMVSVMSACAGLGSLDYAKSIHAYLEKVMHNGETFVWNSVVDAYGKCGSVDSAMRVFEYMCQRDLHSWTAMITGMALHGLGREALDVFSRMWMMGVEPDSITFVAALSACSHAGLVDEGIGIFESMQNVYGIAPEEKHFGCMVDLFSRAGLLIRAYGLIMSMPTTPNLAILGALLSACRNCGNLMLGELVANKIKSSCQYGGGADVLLSNMYADQNQWDKVVFIRKSTRVVDGKPPGRSSIEVKGVVHEFIVEDRSHPHFSEIHLVLEELQKLMEEGLSDSHKGKILQVT